MSKRVKSKRIKLPPTVKPGSAMKLGKGWRLINAKRTGSLKASLVSTFSSGGNRYATRYSFSAMPNRSAMR
jgi:hypothetical protein